MLSAIGTVCSWAQLCRCSSAAHLLPTPSCGRASLASRLLLFPANCPLPLQISHAKQAVDQKLHNGQDRLYQMWLQYCRGKLEGQEDPDSAKVFSSFSP